MNHRPHGTGLGRRRGLRQAGSAYVLAIVVMVLLMVIGLSLALTTQVELQIGAAEAASTRVFYAADAGIEVALARGLASADHSTLIFRMSDSGDELVDGQLEFLSEVETSPFVPISDVACNLCEINNAGTYSESAYRKINHAVASQAERFMTTDRGENLKFVARKRLAGMIEIQPWKVETAALRPIDDEKQISKIPF